VNQVELIQLWQKSWNRIVISQLAPTGLLITTVALAQFGLAQTGLAIRLAALLILLASGILGALAQFSAASEGQAIATQLAAVAEPSVTVAAIDGVAKWLWVVKFVTPAVFVAIFAVIAVLLLG
jgi:hypothetical protein